MPASELPAIASEIDRLAWTVGDFLRDSYKAGDLHACSTLAAPTFGALVNLVPFLHDLSELFIRRRYIYRPESVMDEFLADLLKRDFVTRDGDRLLPTEHLAPIVNEISGATRVAASGFWMAHPDAVKTASTMARTVLEAGPPEYGLAHAALAAPEPKDPNHRLQQRLAGLRLLRNEAHVAAWRQLGLAPRDIEALTEAWAGSGIQAPLEIRERLIRDGYAEGGTVTELGVALRQEIEDTTNAGVAEAFGVVDQPDFLAALRELPGTPSRYG